MVTANDNLRHVVEAAYAVAEGRYAEWHEVAKSIEARHRGVAPEQLAEWVCLTNYAAVGFGTSWEKLTAETLAFYVALYEWARGGYPHFALTTDFFSAVAVTDFGDETSEEPLHMPFPAFTLSFPRTDFFGDASRAVVYRVPSVVWKPGTTVMPDRPPLAGEFDIWWKHYRITLITEDPVFTQWPIGYSRHSVAHDPALLAPTNDYGARNIAPHEAPQLAKLRRMLVNVLTYIDAAGPLPTETRPRRNPPPAPVERTHPTKNIYDVGRVVKLDGALRRAMAASEGDAQRVALAHRFIVRGHWRWQAHGEGRALRRRQWIQPFWKGPENVVEALSRTYEVR
jgi:hypothetical protein